MPRSRACGSAASAPVALRYGLPGTTQTPSKPREARAPSSVGIQYGSSDEAVAVGAGRRAAAGCARGRARSGERSPTRAMRGVGMASSWLGFACRRVHVQRSFAVATSAIMMRVDPRFLRTFVTVAGSARSRPPREELGYTQSARLAAHRRARGRPRHGAAASPAGRADRGRRAAARARASRSCCGSTPRGPTWRAWPPTPPARLAVGATPLRSARLAAALDAAAGGRRRGSRSTLRVADARRGRGRRRDGRARRRRSSTASPRRATRCGSPRGRAAPSPSRRGAAGRGAAGRPPAAPARRGRARGLGDARWIDAPGVLVSLDELRAATGVEGFQAACATRAATSRGCSRSSPRATASRSSRRARSRVAGRTWSACRWAARGSCTGRSSSTRARATRWWRRSPRNVNPAAAPAPPPARACGA